MSTATTTDRTCVVLKSGGSYDGKQGFTYAAGISAESVGASSICMHMLTIPPNGRAKTHLHEHHETAIYMLCGRGRMWYGHQLEDVMDCGPGDFNYIPAGIPHLPSNPSDSEPCVAVLARTDPNEQESVVLRPDLDERFAAEHPELD